MLHWKPCMRVATLLAQIVKAPKWVHRRPQVNGIRNSCIGNQNRNTEVPKLLLTWYLHVPLGWDMSVDIRICFSWEHFLLGCCTFGHELTPHCVTAGWADCGGAWTMTKRGITKTFHFNFGWGGRRQCFFPLTDTESWCLFL